MKKLFKLLPVLLLVLLAMGAYAVPEIKKIDIYVVNKSVRFSVPLNEKTLKTPGLYTKYTLLEEKSFLPFQQMIEAVAEKVKMQPRREMKAIRIVAEIFLADGKSVAFGMNIIHRIDYNGYRTAITGQQFIKKCLQPYISPALNWHNISVDLFPKKIKTKYLNHAREFDGFAVVFTTEAQDFIVNKVRRKKYFTFGEYKQAFGGLNASIFVGINVNSKKIVSLCFADSMDDVAQGSMSKVLFEKYQQVISEKLAIKEIANLYNLKADVIYRIIEFED